MHLCICASMHLSFVHLGMYASLHLSIYLFIYLSICLSICLSIYQSSEWIQAARSAADESKKGPGKCPRRALCWLPRKMLDSELKLPANPKGAQGHQKQPEDIPKRFKMTKQKAGDGLHFIWFVNDNYSDLASKLTWFEGSVWKLSHDITVAWMRRRERGIVYQHIYLYTVDRW